MYYNLVYKVSNPNDHNITFYGNLTDVNRILSNLGYPNININSMARRRLAYEKAKCRRNNTFYYKGWKLEPYGEYVYNAGYLLRVGDEHIKLGRAKDIAKVLHCKEEEIKPRKNFRATNVKLEGMVYNPKRIYTCSIERCGRICTIRKLTKTKFKEKLASNRRKK